MKKIKSIIIIGNGSSGIDQENNIYINNHTAHFLISLKKEFGRVALAQFTTTYSKDSNLLNFNLKNTNIDFIRINNDGKVQLIKDIIYKFFKKFRKYDFIYIFFPGSLGKIIGLLSILSGIKTGFYIRGELFGNNLIDRFILKRAEFLLTVSPVIKKRLEQFNKHVEVIRPMISIDENDIFVRRKFQEKEKYSLLFVGRVEERKGIVELIEAFEILKSKKLNIELTIVGGGDLLDELTSRQSMGKIHKNIFFKGLISDKKMLIDLYRKSDIFVFPSHDEGFPRVLYDAMAQQLPILTTMVGGIPGYMIDKYNCLEIPIKESNGLANKIESIIYNVSLQKKIVHNSLNTLKKILEKKKHETLLIDFIKKNKMKKIWNGRVLGLPLAFLLLIKIIFLKIYEEVNTIFWKTNLGETNGKLLIQKGVVIRWPGNVQIGSNVRIGRNCKIESEIKENKLIIGSNTYINRDCLIDFSGNISIGENVTISEKVIIESHSHGYNPRSRPEGIPKKIENNVWIGANAIILPQVRFIGMGSIIAAGSIVTKDVPPNSIVGGNPAKEFKKTSTSI